MIDLTMHEERLQHAIDRAKERNILIPTFAQMQNPALIPENVKKALKNVGLWDVNPLRAYRRRRAHNSNVRQVVPYRLP